MNLRVLGYGFAALLLTCAPALAADAPPKCNLEQVTSLDADASHGPLLIKVKINGTDTLLQVDTGSPYNMITHGLAEKLGLKELTITDHVRVHDSAGATLRHYVHVDELRLNDMKADNLDFIVMGEDRPTDLRFGGIFGANFLAAYDVEFDIPHGKINLFTQNHCAGQVVYWTQDYDSVPFFTDASLHPVLRASLDGHEMNAILDTGATPSVLSSRTARFVFGLDPIANGDKPDGQVFGGSGTALPIYKHRFGTLEIGGVQFHNTEFDIMPDKTTREIREHQSNRPDLMASEKNAETPLTIGLHHLSKLRAFISYSERRIYISAGDAH